MIYLKILDADGHFSAVEKIETPVYVRYQSKHSLLLQCPVLHAQGILSADHSVAYQLEGKEPIPGLTHTAVVIDAAEYAQLETADPEDDAPVIPDTGETAEVLTRAELTAKVTELEETNAMLLECLLEMSEAVYA